MNRECRWLFIAVVMLVGILALQECAQAERIQGTNMDNATVLCTVCRDNMCGGSCCAQCPPPDVANWHLLTQTYGGTVTLLKELTKHECDYARARALRLPATPQEQADEDQRQENRAKAYKACVAKESKKHPDDIFMFSCFQLQADTYQVSPGDIKSAECFQ